MEKIFEMIIKQRHNYSEEVLSEIYRDHMEDFVNSIPNDKDLGATIRSEIKQ